MAFVTQNCQYYLSDECYGSFSGKCIGGDINEGRLKRESQTAVIYQFPYEFTYPNAGLCWLQEGVPCDYFKRCVLPQKSCSSIVDEYREMCSRARENKPRFCKCGAELVKRERYCSKCKVIERNKAYRKYNRNRKVVIPQLT